MFQKIALEALATRLSRSPTSAMTTCGRLAAELEHDPLEVGLGRVVQEVAPDLGRARERDRVDVGVPADGLADGRAATGHDVEDARRQTRLGRQLGDAQQAQRRVAGRLDDHGVAGRQGRSELPGGHQGRVVPGDDRADHADRLAHDHGQRVLAGRGDVVVELVDGLGVPADGAGRLGDVDGPAVARWACPASRLSMRASSSTLASMASATREQDALAVGRGQRRPRPMLDGLARGADGDVDVGGVALGDVGQGLAGGRVLGREPAAPRRVDEAAVDEQAGAQVEVGWRGGSHGAAPGGRRGRCRDGGRVPERRQRNPRSVANPEPGLSPNLQEPGRW